MKCKENGFTLIELMIVVAIIGIVASLAVPNLLASRIAANEAGAISALRNLMSAQAQFRTTASIDVDSDGAGEYGTFGEMSGLILLNARGVGPAVALDPPILGPPFEKVDASGRARKSGYYFMMYLPDAADLGLPELANGGPDLLIDPDRAEVLWSCYGWPVTANVSGTRTFFIDFRGELLQTKMEFLTYDAGLTPVASAALTGATMSSPPGIGVAPALDGNTWKAVQ